MPIEQPKSPAAPRKVHVVGMAGLAMSGIAAALHEAGWRVTGSDNRVYGRGAEALKLAGLECLSPCAAAHLPEDTDLVLAGATHAADNPELAAARARELPVLTFPEFLAGWFAPGARVLLVAGTNGKTSTTAMLIHALHETGERPSYLIGGHLPGLERSVNLANRDLAVLEADESRCAAWLPDPKFLRLPVTALVLTSLAFDHPETFADEAAYLEAYRALLRRLPSDGFVVLHERDWQKLQPAETGAKVITLGGDSATHRLETNDDGSFDLDDHRHPCAVPGRHQARNTALARVALRHWLGRELPDSCWQNHPGVRGRGELLCSTPIPVYWDIGYHPEALRATVACLRWRHPTSRIRLILRPRLLGNPGSWIEKKLPGALATADWVDSFPEEKPRGSAPPEPDQWRILPVLEKVRAIGREAHFCPTIRGLRESLAATLVSDMVLLFVLSEQHHEVWEGIIPELRNWLEKQTCH